MKTFGVQLRDARVGKALSQEGLAQRTGLTVKTIYRLEAGETDFPSVRALLKITRELNTKFEFEDHGKAFILAPNGLVKK